MGHSEVPFKRSLSAYLGRYVYWLSGSRDYKRLLLRKLHLDSAHVDIYILSTYRDSVASLLGFSLSLVTSGKLYVAFVP